MGDFITYQHHGKEMAVRKDLKGRHREHCLCYSCSWFKPDDGDANCKIANVLFAVDVSLNVVTPVWECRSFAYKEEWLNPVEKRDDGFLMVGLA